MVRRNQAMSSGDTISIPAASPSHQVNQMTSCALCGTMSLATRLVVPTLAPTRHTPTVMIRNQNTSCGRSNGLRDPSKRLSSSAPSSASSVLPTAMVAETAATTALLAALLAAKTVTLATKAPNVMPGQTRYPSSSNAARAIPEGGQTGEALVAANASARPSLAAV